MFSPVLPSLPLTGQQTTAFIDPFSPLTITIIVLVRPLMVTAPVLINPMVKQGVIKSALLVRLMIIIEGHLLAWLLPQIYIFPCVHLLKIGQVMEFPEISKYHLLGLGLLTMFGSLPMNLL